MVKSQECNEILIGFVLWLIALRLALMRRQRLLKFSSQTSIASSADDRVTDDLQLVLMLLIVLSLKGELYWLLASGASHPRT